MIQVKPGQKIPLSATIGDRTAGLVVKATLEKMDGTILTTITLTEVHPGDHTDQSYPMPVAVEYLKAKFRVYDSDGTTPNATNGDFDEIYEVITPILATQLKVKIGCPEEEPALQAPVVVVQTSDLDLLIQFLAEDDSPLDTSQATAVKLRLKKEDLSTLEKTLLAGITPVSGKIGQYLVQMLAADWGTLPLGEQTAQVVLDLGGVHHVEQVPAAVNVIGSIV